MNVFVFVERGLVFRKLYIYVEEYLLKCCLYLMLMNFDFFCVFFRKYRDGFGVVDDVRYIFVFIFVVFDWVDICCCLYCIDVCLICDDIFVIFVEKWFVFVYSGFK